MKRYLLIAAAILFVAGLSRCDSLQPAPDDGPSKCYCCDGRDTGTCLDAPEDSTLTD